VRHILIAFTISLGPVVVFADNAIIAAFRQAAHSSNASVRASAARALCDFDDAGARAELLRLVKDESEVVATAAGEALGKCGGKEASAALVMLLEEESARIEAQQTGVTFRAEAKVPEQFQALQAEANAGRIYRAMGLSHDPAIADVVLKTGLSAKSVSTRIAAVMALGRLKAAAATKPLIAVLEDYYAALPADSDGPTFGKGKLDSRAPELEQMIYLQQPRPRRRHRSGQPDRRPVIRRTSSSRIAGQGSADFSLRAIFREPSRTRSGSRS
jgi:HEAT repeat protein